MVTKFSSLLLFFSQVNPGQVGFYRVCYTKEMVEKLLPAIKDTSLPPLDRLGIENDQFALVSFFTSFSARK